MILYERVMRYSSFETTVFDVWNDLKEYREGSSAGHFSKTKRERLSAIARELRDRMISASRSLPEALWDLEIARRKLWQKGMRRSGTIAILVASIRLKNGYSWNMKKPPKLLEY
jgi:hypothetical protein